MAQPFEDMPAIMNRYANGLQDAVAQVVRLAASRIGETLVTSTRVDTGLARSNWVAQIGSQFGGVIPPYAPGSKLGASETANASGAIAQQGSVIRSYNGEHRGNIHISNNVNYIGVLNNGGPNVGPDMMVERAISAGRAIVKNVRIVRKK